MNQREEIIKNLDKNFEISQLPKFKKIFKKPFKFTFVYFLALIYRIFPNLNLIFKTKSKTIFGDTMNILLLSYSCVFILGFFEYELTKFLLKNLKKGDIFIDGGAHIGYYTLLASKLVGENGKVISFEPTPSVFKILERNIKNETNIVAEQKALFNRMGKIKFIDYGLKDSVSNTWKKRTVDILKNKGKEVKVEATTLDIFCCKNNIKPTFIKLDTEGSESFVLEGMSNILKNIRPILSVEVGGGKEWAENNQKSIGFLKKYGYKPYEINKNGELVIHRIKKEYVYENLIFIPNK